MHEALTRLAAEHHRIERVLDALEAAAGRLQRHEPLAPDLLASAVTFLSGYMGAWHDAKEDALLFSRLSARPDAWSPFRVPRLLAERARAARAVIELQAAVARIEAAEPAAAAVAAVVIPSACGLIRRRFADEEETLFPFVQDHLSPGLLDAALDSMIDLEADHRSLLDHYDRLAAQVEAALSPAAPAGPPEAGTAPGEP